MKITRNTFINTLLVTCFLLAVQSVQAATIGTLVGNSGANTWWVGTDYTSGNWTERVNGKFVTPSSTSSFSTTETGLTFNGSSYFNGTAENNPLANLKDFTILVSFTTTQTGKNTYAWYQNPTFIDNEIGGVNQDWGVSLDSEGKLIIGIGETGKGDYTLRGNTQINDGTLHATGFTYGPNGTGGLMTIYNDGTKGTTKETDVQGTRSANTFTVGTCQTNKSLIYNGEMRQIRTYSRALSTEEAQAVTSDMAGKTVGLYWNADSGDVTAVNWLADTSAVDSTTNQAPAANANYYINTGNATLPAGQTFTPDGYLFIGDGSSASTVAKLTVSNNTQNALKASKGVYLLAGGEIAGTVNGTAITMYGGTLSAALSSLTVNYYGGTFKPNNGNGGTYNINTSLAFNSSFWFNEGNFNLNGNTLDIATTADTTTTIQGNHKFNGGSGTVNVGSGKTGTLVINQSINSFKTLNVGNTTTGKLNIYNGSSTMGTLNIGSQTTSAQGTAIITNGDMTATTFNVGSATAKGTFTQSGGLVNATNLTIHETNGTYTHSAGLLKVTGTLSGSENYAISGSAVLAAGTVDGNLTQNGGVVYAETVKGNYIGNDGVLRVGNNMGLSLSYTSYNNKTINGKNYTGNLPTTAEGWKTFWADIDTLEPGWTKTVSGFGQGVPNEEYFTLTYSGQLYIPEAGTYDFQEDCDDGAFLYIDGKQVLADFNGNTTTNPWGYKATGSIDLTEGNHSFELRYYEGYGGNYANLNWKKSTSSTYSNINNAGVLSLDSPLYSTMKVTGDFTMSGETLEIEYNLTTGEGDLILVDGNINVTESGLLVHFVGEAQSDMGSFQFIKSTDPTKETSLNFKDVNYTYDGVLPFVFTPESVNKGKIEFFLAPEPGAWVLMMISLGGICLLKLKKRITNNE